MAENAGMPDNSQVSITTVTITTKKRDFKLTVNDRIITIPVDADLFAYYKTHFVRQNPSSKQKSELATVMRLMCAAYLKGFGDGKK